MGQHAFDRIFHNRLRTPGKPLVELLGTQSAGIAGIAVINLLSGLHASHLYFSGIDHDNVIASVEERRVLRVMLARKNMCDLGREASQRLVSGIDHVPFARDFPLSRESGGHSNSPKEIKGIGAASTPNPTKKSNETAG